MKLTYLVALLVLLTLGCAEDSSSTPASDSGDAGSATASPDADATSSEATVSEEVLTKVKLNVTGMR